MRDSCLRLASEPGAIGFVPSQSFQPFGALPRQTLSFCTLSAASRVDVGVMWQARELEGGGRCSVHDTEFFAQFDGTICAAFF